MNISTNNTPTHHIFMIMHDENNAEVHEQVGEACEQVDGCFSLRMYMPISGFFVMRRLAASR